jgi:uncharacterized membrane protein
MEIGNMPKKFVISEAVQFGWDTTKSNIGFFIGLLIVVGLIEYVPDTIAAIIEADAPVLSIIIQIASFVLSAIIVMGVIKICLRFCDGEKGEFSDLFSCYPLFFKYLVGSILYGLIVAVGLILLIIPGIIWAIKFQFFDYLIVDKGLGPIDALEKSSEITRGVKWDLFLFAILLGIINLMGFLCLLVGLFVTIPITIVAMAFVYRELLPETSQEYYINRDQQLPDPVSV